MTNETHDKRAAKVAAAGKAYADAASKGRPLGVAETELLDAVGALIGKTLKTV
jgi:hypothetical protein